MSEHAGDLIFYALLLVLPISALVAQRLPVATVIKMALAWLAIFAALFAAVIAVQRWREQSREAASPVNDIAANKPQTLHNVYYQS